MPSEGTRKKKMLLSLLEQGVAIGWLRPLDLAFVRFLDHQEPKANWPVLLAAVFTSHQLGRGHVCLDLLQTLNRPAEMLFLPPAVAQDPLPAAELSRFLDDLCVSSWEQALLQSELVSTGQGSTPLVLDGGRLYLRRFWGYSRQVAASIGDRLKKPLPPPDDLALRLDRWFDRLRTVREKEKKVVHWQSVAAAVAVKSAFSVISGGPGTGKTTTVVHLLALLQELAMEKEKKLRILLAAPTGKAAARLTESIGKALETLPQFLRQALPDEVLTLHRLLGSRPDSRRFNHHAQNPLHVDLLVVDEASMVDLEMMAALLAALPTSARLVFIGDKDQLASVEAGSVLGDISRHWDPSGYTPESAAWLKKSTGYAVPVHEGHVSLLGNQITVLQKNHRFGRRSGIGALARSVNTGDQENVAAVWKKGYADIRQLELASGDAGHFSNLVLDGSVPPKHAVGESVGYRAYLARLLFGCSENVEEDRWLTEILKDFDRFRLLSPLRKGRWGADELNEKIATILFSEHLIADTKGWYPGRPVMVTRNDYTLGLMNGDTGILLPVTDPSNPGNRLLRVVFPLPDGSLRKVVPARLHHVETVFAMTVHKSQGSEFDHTVLVLPDQTGALLTRELIYTAVTRSRTRFTLAGPQVNLMAESARHRTYRASGLGDLLDCL